MVTVSQFIGKHLKIDDTRSDIAKCAICGFETDRNLSLSGVLSENFNDYQKLRHDSERICVFCKACLCGDSWNGKAIRNFSFIATENELVAIKRSDLARSTFSVSVKPFVFCVTFTGKKHIFFNAIINESLDKYVIATEKGNIAISQDEHLPVYTACQALYDAGFSKSEILTGNYRKWSKIGECDDFWILEDQIMLYRNTFLLKYLTFIMSKEPEDDKT
jgi:hypothetical protein